MATDNSGGPRVHLRVPQSQQQRSATPSGIRIIQSVPVEQVAGSEVQAGTESPVSGATKVTEAEALSKQQAADGAPEQPASGLDALSPEPEPDEDGEDSGEEPDLSLLEAPSSEDEEAPIERNEGFLMIHRMECLECKALVPMMKKTWRECHYSKGNANCPAAEVQVVMHIPLTEIVTKIMSLEENGEMARMAKLYAHLATKPDWYQQRVHQALKEARASRRS